MRIPHLCLFALLLLSSACRKANVSPGFAEEDPDNTVQVSLGLYQIAGSSLQFSPYNHRNTMRFRSEDGSIYNFAMSQPAYSSEVVFHRFFAHPDDPGLRVDYEFAGDLYEYEFLSTELGVKLEIIINPDLCEDPKLEKFGQVQDHLSIHARGFLLSQKNFPNPVLEISIPDQTLCRLGKESTGFFTELTLLNQHFEDVYYSKVRLDEFTLGIYYTQSLGIVGMQHNDKLMVLDE